MPNDNASAKQAEIIYVQEESSIRVNTSDISLVFIAFKFDSAHTS